jgi:hypothetical protein
MAEPVNPTPGEMATVHRLPGAIPPVLPEEFWTSRRVFERIRQAAYSRSLAPDGVLAGVLARVATMLDWRVILPPIVGRPQPVNLFITLAAKPGAGKGASLDAARELLPLTVRSRDHLVREKPLGSGEGMAKLYFQEKVEVENGRERGTGEWELHWRGILIRIDEGSILGPMAKRSGQTTLETLRSAWSGELIGGSYASSDRGHQLQALTYRMCVTMGIQPELAKGIFSDSYGGLPQRFVWLSVYADDLPEIGQEPPWPGRLDWKPPPLDLNGEVNGERRQLVSYAPSVEREIREQHRDQLRGVGDADEMTGHLNLSRLKVATVLAAIEGRVSITEEDWAIAGLIMDTSEGVRKWMQARVQVADAKVQKMYDDRAVTRSIKQDDARDERRLQRLAVRARNAVDRRARRHRELGHPSDRVSYKELVNNAFNARDRGDAEEAIQMCLDRDWLRVEHEGDTTWFCLGDSQPRE